MDWRSHAERLAGEVAHPVSRWRPVIAALPRHLFVPRWWSWSAPGTGFGSDVWELRYGPADEEGWALATYSNQSLVTQVGPRHADHAGPGERPVGMPTSSATLPGLIVRLLRHAHVYDGADVVDVGTGSGYGCAVLARRLGAQHVTSVDVDAYLTTVAGERLDGIGLCPRMVTCDATGPLPGTYDRIVSTVAVRPIPVSWLAALRPGGRLVTTIAGTALIITADKTDDGGAVGRIEWDRAGFMHTRTGADYPSGLREVFAVVREVDGDRVSVGRFPVVNVVQAWEIWSMLGIVAPGIEHHYQQDDDGRRTAWMLHPDGSWARATSVDGDAPTVHQSGPRRLWDIVDDIRYRWLRDGSLPVYGATVTITPDGVCHLTRGRWRVTVS
ncbi:MAG: methyltransferase domain-containing protein [Pseudonocardiaceae bacterium]